MEGYSMYFPCYTIGHGVYEKIGKVCRDYGTSAVIIGGHKALAAAQEKVEKACRRPRSSRLIQRKNRPIKLLRHQNASLALT